MTQTSPTQPPSDDALSRLHKMSTTAGVGIGEYVAINPMAVAALVLGAASGLAMLDPILLAVPMIALIIGGLAVVQIGKSAGTQGGMILAILGIVLALGCSAWVGVSKFNTYRMQEADRNGVIGVVDSFGADMLAGKSEEAWSRFSPVFQDTIDKAQFVRTIASLNSGVGIGKVTQVRSNQLVIFETYSDSPDLFSQTMLFVEFQTKDGVKLDDRYEVRLRKVPGSGWRIERLDAFFPPPKPIAPKGAMDPNATMAPDRRGNTQGR